MISKSVSVYTPFSFFKISTNLSITAWACRCAMNNIKCSMSRFVGSYGIYKVSTNDKKYLTFQYNLNNLQISSQQLSIRWLQNLSIQSNEHVKIYVDN